MKTLLAGLVSGLFLFITANSQSIQPINSGEIISKAIKLHDEGKYKDAINLYRQVPRNDTNYAWSLYEAAYSYSLDSNYKEAKKLIKEGLELEDNDHELPLLQLYGSIVDDEGDSIRAIGIYDSALSKYPNSQMLRFNKAVTLIRLKKIDEAEAILKDLLVYNPFYASAHFRLGQCALQKGQVVQAMMSYFTYLLNSPTGRYNNSAIKILNSISQGTDDILHYVENRIEQPEGSYAVIEKILLSKIALDKNYKILTSLDDPIIRQLQVVLEKLQYNAGSNDFWLQFYVPYLKNMFEEKYFEAAVYYAFSDVNIDKIQRYIKKNQKEVNEATAAIARNLVQIRNTREVNYTKRQNLPAIYHFDEGVFFGKGQLNNNNKPMGYWEFYYENGNLKSLGEYTTKGEKQGKWTYYYQDGKPSGYDNWVAGKQNGEDITYNKRGVIITKAFYIDDKLNGEKTNYYAVGHPSTVANYKDDLLDGTLVRYYSNGRKKLEARYTKDELNGPYVSYYDNGQKEVVTSYENGKLQGNYKGYYDNGQQSFEGNYKNNELNGEVVYYHNNGKLQKKLTYTNDAPEGEEIEYNDEGIVIEKCTYKKGKVDGLVQYFDDDGKLYSTFRFENDKLKEATYLNKEGKQVGSSVRQNKNIELTAFNPDGFKISQTLYNDQSQKQNVQNFYYASGKVKESNEYKNGKLEGKSTGYFENGNKQYEISYSNDEKDGLSKYYYSNGKVKSEAWYKEGQLNGNWIEYNENGIITSFSTYLHDDLYGTKQSFFANGKLDYEEIYNAGWLKQLVQYDTLGNKLITSTFVNGSGKYKGNYQNGKPRYEGEMVQGELHGKFTLYFFDGSVQTVKNFDHGTLDGDYTDYYYGGTVLYKGKYNLGKKVGTWKSYSADGKPYRDEEFVNGELNGKMVYYYPNGKVEREIEYKNGERHGAFRRYSEDGQLSNIIYYKNDVVYAYTYNDKNGQLVPKIATPGGAGKVVTFYANGNKSAEMEFVDGKLVGPYKLYHSNGKVYYQSTEEYGISNGKITEHYPNGNVQSEYNYVMDNQDGAYKEYYENGKVKEEGTFYIGYQKGPRKFYDNTGKLTETWNYYYGILMNVAK